MRKQSWLSNLLARMSHRGSGRRSTRRSPTGSVAIAIESVEHRRMLSGGSIVPVGAETQVNSYTTNAQQAPATAMDATGDYVVVWGSFSNDPDHEGVFAQRYNASGIKQDGEFAVNQTNIGDSPTVAMDAAGDFVVAWSCGYAGIFARRYNAAGVALGDEFQVSAPSTHNQGAPKIAMDATGDFAVTWGSSLYHYGPSGSSYYYDRAVHARKYNSAGVPQGNEITIDSANDDFDSSVAMDSSGNFVIAWIQTDGYTGNTSVLVQRYDASGAAKEKPVRTHNSTGYNRSTAVAMDSAGDFVVAWEDAQYNDVELQRYDRYATPQGYPIHMHISESGNVGDPAVVMDEKGNSVVTWDSSHKNDYDYNVYAQGFDANGKTVGANAFGVNSFTDHRQVSPALAMNAKGDMVITWQSDSQDGSDYGVFMQRYKMTVFPNHPPQGAPATVTTLEDKPYAFTLDDFGFLDPNDNPSDGFLAIRVSTLPAKGALKLAGATVTPGQFINWLDIAYGKLIYTPNSNENGTNYSSWTFQVQDDGGTLNGGTDIDPIARKMTMNVTSVNDAPAGTAKTVLSPENHSYTLKVTDFGFTDSKDSPANQLKAVKFVQVPTIGTLKDNGVAVAVNQVIPVGDINSGMLVFTPKTDLEGGPYPLGKFQVQDNGGTANGGADLDPTAKTLSITLTHVNHAPVGTSKTVAAREDTDYIVEAADFGFTDPKDSVPNQLKAVKITALPTNGSLLLQGVAVSLNQIVAVADINSGKLVYRPKPNANGGPLVLCKFQVQDDGGTVNGGIDLDPAMRTMSIQIASVNDAPQGTAKTVTGREDTLYTLKAADFGFTDPKDLPANQLQAVKFSLLPTLGVLRLNGAPLTVGQFVTVADINAGRLVFAPKPNLNGGPYFLCKFQVQDNGGTANGGVNLDPTARVLNVQLASVNDAPVGTAKTVTMSQNTVYTFKTADFGFKDPSDSPANGLNSVKITSLPTLGKLTLNGVTFSVGAFIKASDIAAGKLKFTPVANKKGSPYTSFLFQVQDNGGGANGGVNLDPSPKKMTIAVV